MRACSWFAAMMFLLAPFAAVGPSLAFPSIARACADAWTVAPQPVPPAGSSELDAVGAASATDAWAVGYAFDPVAGVTGTLAERFDGTAWSVVPTADGPNSSANLLSGVDARTPADAWAVGTFIRKNNLEKTLIEHWDGAAWTREPSVDAGQPAGGSLDGVAAIAPDDVWAVGSYGQGAPSRTLIEHRDGTSWRIVPSPNKGPFPNSLSSVAAIAADDVWAVGTWFTKAFVDRTLVLHWDGTSWERVPSPNVGAGANDLVSVDAAATDDVWAVGVAGLKTLTEHWDGTSWSVVKSKTPGGNADLAGVVAIASDDVWAVGGRFDPQPRALRTLVEHWDGTRWSVVASANKGPSDNHLYGATEATGRMFAVGSRLRSGGGGRLAPLMLERCGP